MKDKYRSLSRINDWSVILLVLSLAVAVIKAQSYRIWTHVFFRQVLTLSSGILSEMLFLMIGRIDLSAGGTIAMLKQILCLLILIWKIPFFWTIVFLSIITAASGVVKGYMTSDGRSPYEVITLGLGVLFSAISSGIYVWLLPKVNYIELKMGVENHVIFTVSVVLMTVVCLFMKRTTVGRGAQIFGSDPLISQEMKMPIRKIIVVITLIGTLLLMDNMLCLTSRTDFLTQVDASFMTYEILTGGMIGVHVAGRYKNIVLGLIMGTMQIVLLNTIAQYYNLSAMLIFIFYGVIILISVFTTPSLSRSISIRLKK